MADEISYSGSLTCSNNNLEFSVVESFLADQTTLGGPSPGTLEIGTTYEAISTTDITNKGFAFFKNLDATNFVEIGLDVSSTFYPFIKLLPGQSAIVPLSPAVSLYGRANTAAVKLTAHVLEA